MTTQRLPLHVLCAVFLALPATGCAMNCIEDGRGTTCTAKSLKRFDGAPSAVQSLDVAAGQGVTIDVVYGNVSVGRSTSGKVEVQFMPYVYAAFDDPGARERELPGLQTLAGPGGTGLQVTVARSTASTGVGADTVVRLPDHFDGALSVVNHGNGPVNDFDVKIESVARASWLGVTNQSLLGACLVVGAPTVKSTTVQCGASISVFDVTDDVNVSSRETSHSGDAPVITVRLAPPSPGAKGGTVTSASGSVAVTVSAAGGYTLAARSGALGAVQEGPLPPACTKQEASPQDKTLRCGNGPTYQVTAGTGASGLGRDKPSNVVVAFQ